MHMIIKVRPNDLQVYSIPLVILRGDTLEVQLFGFTSLSGDVTQPVIYTKEAATGPGLVTSLGATVSGTADANGTTTAFLTTFVVGSLIEIAGQVRQVQSVISNTTLTTMSAFSPNIATAITYQTTAVTGNGTAKINNAVLEGTFSNFTTLLQAGNTVRVGTQVRAVTGITDDYTAALAPVMVTAIVKVGDIQEVSLDAAVTRAYAYGLLDKAGYCRLVFSAADMATVDPTSTHTLEIQTSAGSYIRTIFRAVFTPDRDVLR
jgi:hypothetical protein